eukprot:CAMPEP_0114584284 /NCGR_PEP_ID=MMETSP0125-20121206/8005_1 /TAXON_ID=485358 ORGANISM="Aristerostoma sp., Strain ATCC 50986" /NCGR_SAMPLE_ID=MMETSP0125 /ASSEMBLY_ACC=CAM_ASM_000245 /LENGTH=66 /DNA_ID=CAMNT_0001778563 /DNA_START=850 /DNA_END=1050 /DNA_ORIENTATION=-
MKLFDEFGSDWIKISLYFETREPNMLKNRYYNYIKKKGLEEELKAKAKKMDLADAEKEIEEQQKRE